MLMFYQPKNPIKTNNFGHCLTDNNILNRDQLVLSMDAKKDFVFYEP